ncbi:MAG: long-chain fatty acid--CoA ligase [Bacteroidetes bacterium]|nr:long-chain fatty acid--CoA ligase [Bacteroidota bacterium]
MEVTRLFDLLPHIKNNFEVKDDLLAGKENGQWIKFNINQYIETVNNMSYAFLELGIQKGDKIATISNNRPEWNFSDMAIMQVGGIHVPIYPTISELEYRYIFNHAEVQYAFASSKYQLDKIKYIASEVPSLKGIYTYDKVSKTQHLSDLIKLGEKNQAPEKLEDIKSTIKTGNMATLIYTSGTTGDPKGIMLTHANILSNVFAVKEIPPMGDYAKVLSFLPLCHIYERMLTYVYQYLGYSIYYAENIGTIADNIKEVRPHIMSTVPRLLEKIYDKIIGKGRKLKGIKKMIFFWSVAVGLKYEIGKQGFLYNIKLKIAQKLVLSKWHAGLGGRLQIMVSGGAALQSRLGRIFSAAGIHVLEGYGLTETSPVVAVGTFKKNGRKFGTIGPVLDGVEVKIAEDGEILCKGPNVMLGYYKQPELTAEAIDEEGWFHTGDLGVFEKEGQLKLTGRKKEIFKTSFGKYISPQLLENKVNESPFIETTFVVGENQQYAAALIIPEFEHLKSWCRVKEIEYTSDAEMVKIPRIKKRIQKEVDFYNQFLGKTEQIIRIEILDKAFSIDSDELTAKMSLRRNFIIEKYKTVIDNLFK